MKKSDMLRPIIRCFNVLAITLPLLWSAGAHAQTAQTQNPFSEFQLPDPCAPAANNQPSTLSPELQKMQDQARGLACETMKLYNMPDGPAKTAKAEALDQKIQKQYGVNPDALGIMGNLGANNTGRGETMHRGGLGNTDPEDDDYREYNREGDGAPFEAYRPEKGETKRLFHLISGRVLRIFRPATIAHS